MLLGRETGRAGLLYTYSGSRSISSIAALKGPVSWSVRDSASWIDGLKTTPGILLFPRDSLPPLGVYCCCWPERKKENVQLPLPQNVHIHRPLAHTRLCLISGSSSTAVYTYIRKKGLFLYIAGRRGPLAFSSTFVCFLSPLFGLGARNRRRRYISTPKRLGREGDSFTTPTHPPCEGQSRVFFFFLSFCPVGNQETLQVSGVDITLEWESVYRPAPKKARVRPAERKSRISFFFFFCFSRTSGQWVTDK